MAVSITAAWDDARRFVAREAALLVPVALTLLVVPGALLELVTPRDPAQAAAGPWLLSLPVLLFMTLLASLTITRMALAGGVSVGEALAAALRRLPVALGASLVLGLAALLAFMPVAPMMPAAGGVPQVGAGTALILMIYLALLTGGVFYVGVRLLLVNVVVMAEPVGVVAALKRCFMLSKGYFPKLAGLLLLFAVTSLVVGSAVSLAGGVVFVGLGKLMGLEALGRLLLALFSGAANAALSVYFIATLAMVYRQILGPDLSRIFK
ncbi:hypothetical protein [Sphingomonas sp. KC8]|uniref:hypothetical protein n=1 Tax=Sphingomonas sp. KC8 TaxID=1030157 RepID=UPI0002489434|nr:hypothetical protein [Sphingomonas sp. KC8]ARS27191.1 hypothetical protein KC8_07790 [Sphingomonas sp. KC8]